MAELADYLDLTVGQAREQFRALLARRPVASGREVTFLPVETLLCLACSFLVNHRHFGGSTAHQAPEPVPSLARLFSRAAVQRAGENGQPGRLPFARCRHDVSRRSHAPRSTRRSSRRVYRVLLHAARAEGIGHDQLPDFLGLENGGELALLGQEELDDLHSDDLATRTDPPSPRRRRIARAGDGTDQGRRRSVGQHVFAQNVLLNCGRSCVFCGLSPAAFGGRRMLLAGHIKPWKDSSPRERLDCPTVWPPARPTTWPSIPV